MLFKFAKTSNFPISSYIWPSKKPIEKLPEPTPAPEESQKCPKCKTIFKTKSELDHHREKFCKDMLECPICKATYRSEKKLDQHRLKHNAVTLM
jgi:uncharacterized C2H2 Zn-finger protein